MDPRFFACYLKWPTEKGRLGGEIRDSGQVRHGKEMLAANSGKGNPTL